MVAPMIHTPAVSRSVTWEVGSGWKSFCPLKIWAKLLDRNACNARYFENPLRRNAVRRPLPDGPRCYIEGAGNFGATPAFGLKPFQKYTHGQHIAQRYR